MKLNELTVAGHEGANLLVTHTGRKGERTYRVERDESGAVQEIKVHVTKVHGRGHPVDYWKRVRPGSRPRAILREFATEHAEP